MTDRVYEAELIFYWSECENTFYDQCGKRVSNIFEYLTPNDLYLFHTNHNHNQFSLRYDFSILCQIEIEIY